MGSPAASARRSITLPGATRMPSEVKTWRAIGLSMAIAEAQHAGMGVGHRQHLEHALDAAILAVFAVQGVEHHVGPAAAGRPQEIDQRAQVALDVVFDDLVAAFAQALGAGLAAHQRDLALGRPAAHQDRDLAAHAGTLRCGGFPSRSRTPLLLEHAPPHFLAQRLDVGRGGGAEIDQEVAMLLGDLRLADAQAAAAGLVDQLPRLVAGRIGEGRAAGAAARLRVRLRAESISAMRRGDRELVAGRGAAAAPR